MARIMQRLGQLEALSPAALRAEWGTWFKDAPPRLAPELMRHAIAYAMQEKTHGKLPARIVRQITSSGAAIPSSTSLSPGTQLVRSWNRKTISVLVSEDGYVFEERTYRSLSAIAREVTGAHWSGPRFFGLNDHGR